MYILTIAIPTYNRLDNLRVAINQIRNLSIPNNWNICLAISNIASDDGTYDYLRGLDLENLDLYIYNEPQVDMYSNWVYLSKVVPSFTDWVWLHGDDDCFIDSSALLKITNIIDNKRNLNLLIVPQAKRLTGNGEIIEMPLIDLCNQFGFHEMLGWMSQLVFRYQDYIEVMVDYSVKQKSIASSADLTARQISSFHHSISTLKHMHSKAVALVNHHLIEEQIPVGEKKEHTIGRLLDENVRQRFFYVINDLVNIKDNFKFNISDSFFRYVNRDFRLLLLDILISDILSSRDKIFLDERIEILKMIPRTTFFNAISEEINITISDSINSVNIYLSTRNNADFNNHLELQLVKCRIKHYNQFII